MADLNEYKQCVEEIKRYAIEHNVSQAKTLEIFNMCFHLLEVKYKRRPSPIFRSIKITLVLLLTFIASLICIYNNPTLNSIVMRNLQNSIYPGLKIFRKLAVPVVNYYPTLSELYDEWCLMENPYFRVSDIDCWPCSVVHSVPDLTGHNITRSFNFGIPYTRTEKDTGVNMQDLVETYLNNSDVFEEEAKRVISNNAVFSTVQDVMHKRLDLYPSELLNTHVLWRVTRMRPGRILRKLFPKPRSTPKWWSQSTEKFVFIDEANSASYTLPNPECSNVITRCTNGGRLIKMVPSVECLHSCRTSTILLSKGQTLWYNWWYWRPVSLPISNMTDVSITYLTSFC